MSFQPLWCVESSSSSPPVDGRRLVWRARDWYLLPSAHKASSEGEQSCSFISCLTGNERAASDGGNLSASLRLLSEVIVVFMWTSCHFAPPARREATLGQAVLWWTGWRRSGTSWETNRVLMDRMETIGRRAVSRYRQWRRYTADAGKTWILL